MALFIKEGSLGTSKTTAPMDLYVHAVSGSNLNSGLTPANALQTLDAAISKVPDYVNHRVVIHVGAHQTPGYVAPTILNKQLSANLYIIGDGAGIDPDGGFTVLSASTLGTGTSTTLAQTAGGMTANTVRGRTIEILDGPAAGNRRLIRNNETASVVPVYSFSATPASGNLYRIVDPAIKIFFSGTLQATAGPLTASTQLPFVGNCGQSNFVGDSGGVYFINFEFVNATGTIAVTNSKVNFFGCVGNGGGARPGFSFVRNSLINLGVDSQIGNSNALTAHGPFIDQISGAFSQESWVGWGFSHPVAGTARTTIDGSQFFGFLVTNAMLVRNQANVSIRGGNIFGTTTGVLATFDVQSNAFLSLQSPVTALPVMIQCSGANGCVLASEGATAFVNQALATNLNGAAIQSRAGGNVRLLTVGISGSTYGALARFGGRITLETAASIAAISGAAGDFSIDGSTAVADTFFNAAGVALTGSDLSLIVRTA